MVDPQVLSFAKSLPKTFEDASLEAVSLIWSIFLNLLWTHRIVVTVALFTVFVAVTIKATYGRCGILGSFLYNFIYLGALFLLGLVFGPGIFINDWFNAACTIILYPACYWLVGRILVKTRFLEYA